MAIFDEREQGEEADLLRKIRTDVAAAGKEISEHRLRKRLDELAAIAREQMLKG